MLGTQNHILRILGATGACCLLLLAHTASICKESAARPNLILIVVDTLRADHLGCYGYPHDISPGIDALAAESVVYERAYSQAPWTVPSLVSLLSSRLPGEVADWEWWTPVPDEAIMLAEVLASAGYETAAVTSHYYYFRQEVNLTQGFKHVEQHPELATTRRSSGRVTNGANKFIVRHLKSLESDEKVPFFLFLHYFDPHSPYLYAARDGSQVDGEFRRRLGFSEQEFRTLLENLGETEVKNIDRKLRDMSTLWISSEQDLWPTTKRHGNNDTLLELAKRLYALEVAHVDHSLGSFFSSLESMGLLDDTIVVLTSDHGEEFLDHGGWDHAETVYEEMIRVPLLVRWPERMGIEPRRIKRPVQLVDVFPTLMRSLGIEIKHSIAGRVLPLDEHEEKPRNSYVFSESTFILENQPGYLTPKGGQLGQPYNRALIWRGYKLIQQFEPRESYLLFNLEADPGEKHDLAERMPRKVNKMKELLDTILDQTRARSIRKTAERPQLSEEELATLKALGYL